MLWFKFVTVLYFHFFRICISGIQFWENSIIVPITYQRNFHFFVGLNFIGGTNKRTFWRLKLRLNGLVFLHKFSASKTTIFLGFLTFIRSIRLWIIRTTIFLCIVEVSASIRWRWTPIWKSMSLWRWLPIFPLSDIKWLRAWWSITIFVERTC